MPMIVDFITIEKTKTCKSRVLANYYRDYFFKLKKNTGFEPKFDQAALEKVAKTRGFCNTLFSPCRKFRLKLGVFDDFASSKRTRT